MTNIFTKNKGRKIALLTTLIIMVVALCAGLCTLFAGNKNTANATSGNSFVIRDLNGYNIGTTLNYTDMSADNTSATIKVDNLDNISENHKVLTQVAGVNTGVSGNTTGFQFGADYYRTDSNNWNIQGSWKTPITGILVHWNNYSVQYHFMLVNHSKEGVSNGIGLYVWADNTAFNGARLNARIWYPNVPISGTGAPTRVDVAYVPGADASTAGEFRFLVNGYAGFRLTHDNIGTGLDNSYTGVTEYTAQKKAELWAYYYALFYSQASDKTEMTKYPMLGTYNVNANFSHVTYETKTFNAWGSYASRYNTNTDRFTNNAYTSAYDIDGKTPATATSIGVSGPNDGSRTVDTNRIFNTVYDNNTSNASGSYTSELSTTGDFYVQFTSRVIGYTKVDGTWQNNGFLVRINNNGAIDNYKFIIMRETSQIATMNIVKYASDEKVYSIAYRFVVPYEGTGAEYTAKIFFDSVASTYYLEFNGSTFAITNYSGDANFTDLFSNTSSKSLGLFSNKHGIFSNINYTVNATTAQQYKADGFATAGTVYTHTPIRFNTTFNDGMVLQRGTGTKVFGYGGVDGNQVEVSIVNDGSIKTAVGTIANGAWSVAFSDKLVANKTGVTLTATEKSADGATIYESATVENVVVGEVWLANGQSNMDYTYYGLSYPNNTEYGYYQGYNNTMSTDFKTYNNYDNIRFLRKTHANAASPVIDVTPQERWQVFTDLSTAEHNSATALAFASNLSNWFGNEVPIGVAVVAFGGSYIEQWMDSASITAANAHVNQYVENKSQRYNGMMHNLVGYSFSGFLFYQGCANWNLYAKYEHLFTQYAEQIREDFGANLPIISVQLPQFNNVDPADTDTSNALHYGYAPFRAMQQRLAKKIPNMYLVSTIDLGDNRVTYNDEGVWYENARNNIHPANKWEVGVRGAGIAAREIYKLSAPDTIVTNANVGKTYGVAPEIVTANWTNNSIYIRLSRSAQLVSKANNIYGFEVSYDNGTSWSDIPVINSNNVLIARNITSKPTNIRYMYKEIVAPTVWYNDGHANSANNDNVIDVNDGMFIKGTYTNTYFIYNQYGLPLFPAENIAVIEGVMPNGVDTTYGSNLFYWNNSLLHGQAVWDDGKGEKAYTATDGVWSEYSGDLDGKYYENGIAYTGFRRVGETEQSDGTLYYYTNGTGTPYTGLYGDKQYENGVLSNSFVTEDGILYKYTNGVKATYTGDYEGKRYQNGTLFTGLYNNKAYENGVLFTGIFTDNKYYIDGTPGSGFYPPAGEGTESKLYKDGNLYTGFFSKDGKLYVDGLLYTGTYTDGLYYNQGVVVSAGAINSSVSIVRRDEYGPGVKFTITLSDADYVGIYVNKPETLYKEAGLIVIPKVLFDEHVAKNGYGNYHQIKHEKRIAMNFRKGLFQEGLNADNEKVWIAEGVISNIYLHNVSKEFVFITYVGTGGDNPSIEYKELGELTVKDYTITIGDVASNTITNNSKIQDVNDILKSYVEMSIYSQVGVTELEKTYVDGQWIATINGYQFDGKTFVDGGYYLTTDVNALASAEFKAVTEENQTETLTAFNVLKKVYPITFKMDYEDVSMQKSYSLKPTPKIVVNGETYTFSENGDTDIRLHMPFGYSSDDTGIVSITNGVLKAESIGSATITITFDSNYVTLDTASVSLNVHVIPNYSGDDYTEYPTSLYDLYQGYGCDASGNYTSGLNQVATNAMQRWQIPVYSLLVVQPGYKVTAWTRTAWEGPYTKGDSVSAYSTSANVYELPATFFTATNVVQALFTVEKIDGSAITLEEAAANFKIYVRTQDVRTIKGSYGYSASSLQIGGMTLTADQWYVDKGLFKADPTTMTYTLTVYANTLSGGHYLKLTSGLDYNSKPYNEDTEVLPSITTDGQDLIYDIQLGKVILNDDSVLDNPDANGLTMTGAPKYAQINNGGMNRRVGGFRYRVTSEYITNPNGEVATWKTGGIAIIIGSYRYVFFAQGLLSDSMALYVNKYSNSDTTSLNPIASLTYYQKPSEVVGTGSKMTLDMQFINGMYIVRVLKGTYSGTELAQFVVSQHTTTGWTGASVAPYNGTDIYTPTTPSLSVWKDLFDESKPRYFGFGNVMQEDSGSVQYSDIYYEGYSQYNVRTDIWRVPVVGKVENVSGKTYVQSGDYKALVNEVTGEFVLLLPANATHTITAYKATDAGFCVPLNDVNKGSVTVTLSDRIFYNASITLETTFYNGDTTTGGSLTLSAADGAITEKDLKYYEGTQNFRVSTSYKRSDGTSKDGGWATGAISINNFTNYAYTDGHQHYTFIASTNSNGTYNQVFLNIHASNGAVMNITSQRYVPYATGAEGKLDIAWYDKHIYVLVDGAYLFDLTYATITSGGTLSTGQTVTYSSGSQGYFDPLFRNSGNLPLMTAISAVWTSVDFTNINTYAITELPEDFKTTTFVGASTSYLDASTTDMPMGGANKVVMKPYSYAFNSTAVSANKPFYIDVTFERVSGHSVSGTHNTGGVAVRVNGAIYHIFMIGHGSSAGLYVVGNKSSSTLGGTTLWSVSVPNTTYLTGQRNKFVVAYDGAGAMKINVNGNVYTVDASRVGYLCDANYAKEVGFSTGCYAMEFSNVLYCPNGINIMSNW